MTKADVALIRIQRGRVLANLAEWYGTPVLLDSLWRTVCWDTNYDAQRYRRDITYLHEKGLVRFVDEAIGGERNWWHKVVTLTAQGKEIAEGTATDPALEI